MSSHPQGRSGSAALAALTVLALVAGGWWWTATDPHADATGLPRVGAFPVPGVGPVPGQVGPAAGQPAYSSRLEITSDPDRAVRARQWPTGGTVALVDPATGQAVSAPSPEDLLALADSGSGPSPLGTVLWREDRVLTDNVREVRRQVAGATNARYRLLLLCHGRGDLVVRVWNGGSGRTQQEVRCDGALAVHGVHAAGGPITVRLSHPTEGPAEVNAVFLELP